MERYFGLAQELLEKGLARQVDSYGEESLYDRVITFADDLDFYTRLAQEQEGKVLDIGCGTGRVTLPLLEAGIDVVGLDLNETMLDVARQKLMEKGYNPSLYQGDMRNYQLEERFALIIIPYYAMIYMTSDDDRKQVLKAAYQHLEPGGVLAFDFDAGSCSVGMTKPWLSLQEVNPTTGEVTVQTAQMNCEDENLRVVNMITYRYNGDKTQVEVNASYEATCSTERMQELLEGVGFTVSGFYADYELNPYQGGEECLVIAQK